MQLNPDFTQLKIEAAKMLGLEQLLRTLRELRVSYEYGLATASEFVSANGGEVSKPDRDGVTFLNLGEIEAACFKPYDDLDGFYYES